VDNRTRLTGEQSHCVETRQALLDDRRGQTLGDRMGHSCTMPGAPFRSC
jgi:hypothetical protein